MAGFGLPNFGQITEAFRKAQKIQEEAQKLQEELDEMEIEGLSEDGRVSVWLSGNQKPIKVRIDKDLIDAGQIKCEEATLSALKNAYEESTKTMKSKMEELTGGLNFNLPGVSD